MATLRLFILVSALAWVFQTRAFDADKCGELFPKAGDQHRPYMAPIYSTTVAPSVSSYFSSFGKCSMYGNLEREIFIAQNYPQLTHEAAQGGGEHLLTLSALSGCSVSAANDFSTALKSNHAQVFQTQEELSGQIDRVIEQDTNLQKSCQITK